MASTTLGSNRLVLTGRENCYIYGLNNIISMNDKEIILDTSQGVTMIKGNKLRINNLIMEDHEITIIGRIDSITYAN